MQFANKVVDVLKHKPAYVVVFAVFVMAVCLLGYAINKVPADQSATSLWVALTATFIALVATVVTVFRLEGSSIANLENARAIRQRAETAAQHLTGQPDIDSILNAIVGSLRDAIQIPNNEFRKIVVSRCGDLSNELSHIKNGQVTALGRQYNRLALHLETSAKRSLIAVHTGIFLDEWALQVGSKILDKPVAQTTRIFVFNYAKDVTDRQIQELKRLAALNQEIRIFFDKESHLYSYEKFPFDYRVIDDGEIICVTNFDAQNGFSGRWHFNDQTMVSTHRDEASLLKNASKLISEVYP